MSKSFFIFIVPFTLLWLGASAPVFAQQPGDPDFVGPVQPSAPIEYKLLAPIPIEGCQGLDSKKEECKTNTATYLPGLYRLIIMIAAAMAVVMIIYGGIKYMSTDAFGEKNEAKGIIENALWGLLLTMSAWLIINTINPNLVKLDLRVITPQTITERLSPENFIQLTGCSDCLELGEIEHKQAPNGCAAPGPCVVRSDLHKKLTELNNAFPNLYITESFPPTRVHQNACHNTGDCVDAQSVSANQLYEFIDKAGKANLRAVFEVESEDRKNILIRAACGQGSAPDCRPRLGRCIAVYPPVRQADGTLKRQITAEHFSVYNEAACQ